MDTLYQLSAQMHLNIYLKQSLAAVRFPHNECQSDAWRIWWIAVCEQDLDDMALEDNKHDDTVNR